MNYDLTTKIGRRKFTRYANHLLKKHRTNVTLEDESAKTIRQNRYLHVLCRILANDIGVSEEYAKDMYFKRLANRDIFLRVSKDPLTGKMQEYTRSICDLTIDEIRIAIQNFVIWAAEHKYELPVAIVKDDKTIEFTTPKSQQAFHQAETTLQKR